MYATNLENTCLEINLKMFDHINFVIGEESMTMTDMFLTNIPNLKCDNE